MTGFYFSFFTVFSLFKMYGTNMHYSDFYFFLMIMCFYLVKLNKSLSKKLVYCIL